MALILKISKMTNLQRRILKYLSDQYANTQLEIAQAIQSNQPSVSRSINQLLHDEIVVRNKNRQYCINPILKKQSIDWELISYPALTRQIQLFRNNTWDKIAFSGIEVTKAMRTLDPLKNIATINIRQAAVFQTTDISKLFTESAKVAKKLSKLIDFPAMISMRDKMLQNTDVVSKLFKSIALENEKALSRFMGMQSQVINPASILYSGIEKNLLLDNQITLKTISDVLPYDVLKYHNQLTNSLKLHNQLFPEPYSKIFIQDYEERNFEIRTDFLYRASLPIKPIIQPYEQLDIQIPPPKNRLREKVNELIPIINQIDPLLVDNLFGAINAFESKDYDYLKHTAVSIRSVIKSFLSNQAPRKKVSLHLHIKKENITVNNRVEYAQKWTPKTEQCVSVNSA